MMKAERIQKLRNRLQIPEQRDLLYKSFTDKFMPEPNTGCWIWTASTNLKGYGRFLKHYKAHRFSYEFFNGPLASDICVCHTCDNPYCVNPKHLFLGTHTDNVRDRFLKGRSQKGSKHFKAKVNEVYVKIIREAHALGYKTTRIAEYFGLSHGATSSIIRRKQWKHV